MSAEFLPAEDADLVRQGNCPKCGSGRFLEGPRGGLSRNVLCMGCFREYNRGPVAVELLHEACPQSRRVRIYGVLT